jgi:hypothetical protein
MEIKQLEEGLKVVHEIDAYKSTKEDIKQTLKKLASNSIGSLKIDFCCMYQKEDQHHVDERIIFNVNKKFYDLSLKVIKDLYTKHIKFCEKEIRRLKKELKKI